MVRVRRIYDPPPKNEGTRFLVDRLWPRAMKKGALSLDGWLKEVTPSDGLQRWVHKPSRWGEFRRRYFAELDGKPETWRPILKAAHNGTVTLLYSAKDPTHNNAAALRDYLLKKLGKY